MESKLLKNKLELRSLYMAMWSKGLNIASKSFNSLTQ